MKEKTMAATILWNQETKLVLVASHKWAKRQKQQPP